MKRKYIGLLEGQYHKISSVCTRGSVFRRLSEVHTAKGNLVLTLHSEGEHVGEVYNMVDKYTVCWRGIQYKREEYSMLERERIKYTVAENNHYWSKMYSLGILL